MFVKRGDGKIISVIETEEITEEQKKIAQDISDKNNQLIKDNADKSKKG